ncbi:MAG: metallophosphoesterase [Chlamydiales bacterium]
MAASSIPACPIFIPDSVTLIFILVYATKWHSVRTFITKRGVVKIAIVNDVHVGKSLEHDGKVRASSHLMEDMFESFLEQIAQHHSPDIIVNLGDLIRSEKRETDLTKYQKLIEIFEKIKIPVIHLLGNHELKKMPLNEIENLWQHHGFSQKSFGRQDFDKFTLIWLGLELDSVDHRIRLLPLEQLEWLEIQLKKNQRPTIIFTHCAIDDHDVKGNFFFEATDNHNTRALFLQNQEAIRKIISSYGNVVAVFQAHLHYFHTRQIDGIPYITCPAMGDNIYGPNVKDNIPEIYTLLTFQQNHVSAKAYSGKYCFAGCEWD